ncbi:MAG: UDP-N-acetylmuramoyl-L-alanyl-D-glutamate--2,6-diaminopimelate ligase, partial [Acidobacteriaceae bacterium]|nr:UDP-N-acetylmuramoyl-L-alanyl-D-glutamate--2,6-diaminopimelate ligase [Acidobacteriaceae bacterium]
MHLQQVFEAIPVVGEMPAELVDSDVRGLAYDSRKVEPGYLFFAFAGAKADGGNYAATALAQGALGVVSDRPAHGPTRPRWIQVAQGREALALAARNFYDKPDERVYLTGVTGTNGKTTSTLLIDSILRAAGKTTALIGTIEYHLAGRVLPAVNTTPESLDLFRMCDELSQAGGTHST